MDEALRPVFEHVADARALDKWSVCVLTRSIADADSWHKVSASPVDLSGGPAVKVVKSIGRREEARTVPLERWPAELEALVQAGPERVHVTGTERDWHARRTKRGRWLVSSGKPSARRAALSPHDRERRYPLPPEDEGVRRLFVATGLFSPAGNLRREFAGKYRQVQHYVELLRALPVWEAARAEGRPLRVVDGGCGKAYMSLALYAFAEREGLSVDLVGVDSDRRVVDKVQAIAAEIGYTGARFRATSIREFAAEAGDLRPDLFVSLHACDTATDEALAAGVRLGARAIVLAPCCHRELAGQLLASSLWAPVLRHGLLRGRLAEIVTDGLRANALELFGYRAEAIEFVAAEHTAKNLMLRAARRPPGRTAEAAARRGAEEYRRLAEAWGVRPTLEDLLADVWPAAA